jgi:GDP-4-dehydro-6-deoxy-D-mannose reductase
MLQNTESNLGQYQIENFDLRLGNDIRDYEQIRKAVDEFHPDLIFHLAAQAFVPESSFNPHRGFSVNLTGTLNLLEAVRQVGLQPKVLVAGTSEEYGYDRDEIELTEESVAKPTTPYGVTKLAGTTLCMTYVRNYNLDIVCTRAWNHIGPGASPSYAVSAFAKRIAEAEKYGTPVTHGNLESVRNYTDVLDIIKAYVKVIDCPSGIYNLASSNTVSAKWVLDTLTSFVKKPINFEPNDKLFRPMSLKFPKPNTEKIKNMTGWQASVPIESSLLEILNYWRKII